MADRSVRWCLCRVLEEIDNKGGRHRKPNVGAIEDPGAPLVEVFDPETDLPTGVFRRHSYSYTAAISSGLPGEDNDWCLVQVVGFDMSGLNSNPDVINLFEADTLKPEMPQFTGARLRDVMDVAARKRLDDKLDAAGISKAGLSPSSQVRDYIHRCGQKWNSNFDIEHENVG